jgi:hypothetical protein
LGGAFGVLSSTYDKDGLVCLVEELLDAPLDTVEMVLDCGPDADWLSHVEYLKGLQRHGRAAIARTTAVQGGGAAGA